MKYQHVAKEPDWDMPAILCSICNEQGLTVEDDLCGNELRFECLPCEYVWELNVNTLEWVGYALEGSKWDELRGIH